MTNYVVKRGDSLWKIASNYGQYISGNTINAKIDTLVAVNGIKNRNLIYVGQVINFASGSGSTSSSSSSSPAKKPTVTAFGLALKDDSGTSKNRGMYAAWSFSGTYASKTAKYKYKWSQYKNGKWVSEKETETESAASDYCYSEWTADDIATKVQFKVIPVSTTHKDSDGNEVADWTDPQWSTVSEYNFANNPPLTPSTPSKPEIDNSTLTLTVSISNIKASELDAVSVKFNIVQDNSTSIATSGPVTINTASNYVAWQYTVEPGHIYTVRACCVGSNGKESGWSDFSEEAGTKPSAPSIKSESCRRVKRTDGKQAAHLEWSAVSNAETYKIEWVTTKTDFDTAPENIQSTTTDDDRTSIEILFTDSELGYDYFFRIRAVNGNGTSDPSEIVEIPIGSLPGPPSTYSSSNSAFVGDDMELNWVHNPTDNSKQSYAELALNINDSGWTSFVIKNTTDENDTAESIIEDNKWKYGQGISYKGALRFKMDTTHADLRNAKVIWRVRTAGVTDQFSDEGWSVERTIYIYEKPTLGLSMTSDIEGTGTLITTLTSFPFYIRGLLSITDYNIQKPVGYHLRIVSNDYYATVDDIGNNKVVNPGDDVYSKYFDTTENPLIVEISANNIDLEPGIEYTVYCSADMSTGLTVDNQHDFTVNWVEVEYGIQADITIDKESYTAMISPYCMHPDGGFVENVTLSVYRREYDGSYKEIATNIPNNNTAVTDPHPALDYARYRLVAKDTNTGAISYYDMPGQAVNCTSIILQWDEAWRTFDSSGSTTVDIPPWSGSLLELPYNIKVNDSRKRDTSLVEYAGRSYPVSYYGTQIDESQSWSADIPATDKDTIYALRRLSLWAGDVYVREPSGMGYWANLEVSFSKNYDEVTIPVTINVTRVEGGV